MLQQIIATALSSDTSDSVSYAIEVNDVYETTINPHRGILPIQKQHYKIPCGSIRRVKGLQ
jgi:hypothetical protein